MSKPRNDLFSIIISEKGLRKNGTTPNESNRKYLLRVPKKSAQYNGKLNRRLGGMVVIIDDEEEAT